MKKLLILSLLTSVALLSCGGNANKTSGDKDSIEASRAADSMIQDQLNSDTSMNTDSTTDNMSTDSMPKSGKR